MLAHFGLFYHQDLPPFKDNVFNWLALLIFDNFEDSAVTAFTLRRMPDVKPKQYFAVKSSKIKIFQFRKLFPKAMIKISLEMVRNCHYLPPFQCYARSRNNCEKSNFGEKISLLEALALLHLFWIDWAEFCPRKFKFDSRKR